MPALRFVFVALTVALLASPHAAASREYRDYVDSTTNGFATPGTDAYSMTATLPVTLGPGDTVLVDLTYTDRSHAGLDDLDLVLYSPFYAPVDLLGSVYGADVPGELAALSHYADQRGARTACASPTAASHHHLAGTSEHIAHTLGAGEMQGDYDLEVTAFLLVDDYAPFTLTVTVLDAQGFDVTLDRTGNAMQHVALINPYAYCDLGLTDP